MKLRSGKIAKKPRLANVPDDFALLPNDIKRDIIDVGMFQERKFDARDLDDLKSEVEGSWAEHAKQAAETCSLRKTELFRSSSDEMKHRAAELYESLNLKNVYEDVYNLLKQMGTRFSCVIVFDCRDYLEPITRQIADFLDRQLKSKYLRSLVLDSNTIIGRRQYNFKSEGSKLFEQVNLNLCVDFVKRPQFEKLHLDMDANLPFEVFEEAHKSWEAAERFEVRRNGSGQQFPKKL